MVKHIARCETSFRFLLEYKQLTSCSSFNIYVASPYCLSLFFFFYISLIWIPNSVRMFKSCRFTTFLLYANELWISSQLMYKHNFFFFFKSSAGPYLVMITPLLRSYVRHESPELRFGFANCVKLNFWTP